jgi:hypothetical protein
MITPEFAQLWAQQWVDAWNAHDVDRVLVRYSDDVEMSTPFIARATGDPTGTVRGKANVRAYWLRALERMPGLNFELIEVLTGVDSLCIYYHSVEGLRAVEWVLIGEDGRAVRAIGHYSAS